MVLWCAAGTCLSFSHEDRNLFVVGAENGSVFKCSMQGMTTENIDETTGVCVRGVESEGEGEEKGERE